MFEVSKLQAWEVHSLKIIITLLSFIKDTSAWSLIKMKSCMPGRGMDITLGRAAGARGASGGASRRDRSSAGR